MSRQSSLTTVENLRPSERRFVIAMQQLGYGSFEGMRIHQGELVLDPWPTTIRSVKFGNSTPNQPPHASQDFQLKEQIVQLFELVRGTNAGMIRVLEIRGALPFSVEMEAAPAHD